MYMWIAKNVKYFYNQIHREIYVAWFKFQNK